MTQDESSGALLSLRQDELEEILDAVHTGIIRLDAQGIIRYANAAACEILGYRIDDLLNMSGSILFSHDEQLPGGRQFLAGESDVRDFFHHHDGYPVAVVYHGTAFSGDALQHGLLLTFHDIRAQVNLESSLKRFLRAVEQSPSTIIITDMEGRIEYSNPKLTELTGYTLEEVRGKTASIFSSGETPVSEYARLWQTICQGGEWRGEFHNRKKNGELYWEFASISPLRNARGQITHFLAVKEDITERKRMEFEREVALAELETTLDSIADALLIFNDQGRLTRMNRVAERLLGYNEATRALPPLHRPIDWCYETSDGQVLTAERDPVTRALQGETTHELLMVLRWPNREARVALSAAPIRNPGGAVLGAVLTLTDTLLLHELQEQQRVFIHTISHDLRNPLAVIQGYARLLQDDLPDQDDIIQQSISAIIRSARRMDVMIEDMVDAARLDGGQLQLHLSLVNLDNYLDNYLQRMAPSLDVHRVHLEITDPLPPVSADYDRMERIITNLLSNALKYSNADSPVVVRVTPSEHEVVISVIDAGCGIAPEDLSRVFQRFFRAEHRGNVEGLGLGLYITRMLVEAHGGKVWLESTPGEGSTFSFTLPTA